MDGGSFDLWLGYRVISEVSEWYGRFAASVVNAFLPSPSARFRSSQISPLPTGHAEPECLSD